MTKDKKTTSTFSVVVIATSSAVLSDAEPDELLSTKGRGGVKPVVQQWGKRKAAAEEGGSDAEASPTKRKVEVSEVAWYQPLSQTACYILHL